MGVAGMRVSLRSRGKCPKDKGGAKIASLPLDAQGGIEGGSYRLNYDGL